MSFHFNMLNIQTVEKRLISFNRKIVKQFIHNKFPPATSIGGIYSKKSKLDYSQRLITPISIQLQNALMKLGKIGSPSTISNNSIGHCCEVHVANKLILNHPIQHTVSPDKIRFTHARRPRTNQLIKRCPNCSFIFGPEK